MMDIHGYFNQHHLNMRMTVTSLSPNQMGLFSQVRPQQDIFTLMACCRGVDLQWVSLDFGWYWLAAPVSLQRHRL